MHAFWVSSIYSFSQPGSDVSKMTGGMWGCHVFLFPALFFLGAVLYVATSNRDFLYTMPHFVFFLEVALCHPTTFTWPKWSSREKDIQHRGRTQGPTLRGKCKTIPMRLLR